MSKKRQYFYYFMYIEAANVLQVPWCSVKYIFPHQNSRASLFNLCVLSYHQNIIGNLKSGEVVVKNNLYSR